MIDASKYKVKLEEEKKKLESELSGLGRRNPDNKADWEATEHNLDTDTADEGEVGDAETDFATNRAILDNLEPRLAEVNLALSKIEDLTYGVCIVCGGQIEEQVLDANPASQTCKAHIN